MQPDPSLSLLGVLQSRGTSRMDRQTRGTRWTAVGGRGADVSGTVLALVPSGLRSGMGMDGSKRPSPSALCPHSGAETTEKPHGCTCLPGHVACVTLAADTAPHASHRRVRLKPSIPRDPDQPRPRGRGHGHRRPQAAHVAGHLESVRASRGTLVSDRSSQGLGP